MKTLIKHIDIEFVVNGQYVQENYYVADNLENAEVVISVHDGQFYNTKFIFFNNSSDENVRTCAISENYIIKLTKDGDKWLVNVISSTEPETKFKFSLHTITRKENVELVLKSELEQYQLKSNTTITHYCPIEESMNKIDDFVVGAPVYLTGKVYKYDKATKQFISSTESDTTDCICSVKTNGKWNEFVGICTSKDDKCITFATHGDYLVRVTDTSCYGIGDEVFVDEGELKTLTGQTAITSKIRRTTVGIITSKISDTMLSVFKA